MGISLREACNCIGITGKISIVRDFYGYGRIAPSTETNVIPAPFPGSPGDPGAPGIESLSLLQQVRLIKNGPHIRLHIKIVPPVGGFLIFDHTIDQQVSAMRQVYAGIGIAVVLRSIETLALPSSFSDIIVNSGRAASYQVISLFQNLNKVPTTTFHSEVSHFITDIVSSTEIVVYIVSTVTKVDPVTGNKTANGSAAYPDKAIIEFDALREKLLTIPGAVIANDASIWTLAHEVGHVLGLDHTENSLFGSCPTFPSPQCQLNSLMTCCSTDHITSPPPDLSASEISNIYVTGLQKHLFKKCGDF